MSLIRWSTTKIFFICKLWRHPYYGCKIYTKRNICKHTARHYKVIANTKELWLKVTRPRIYIFLYSKRKKFRFLRKFIEKINNRNSQNDGKNFKYFITGVGGRERGLRSEACWRKLMNIHLCPFRIFSVFLSPRCIGPNELLLLEKRKRRVFFFCRSVRT